MASRTSSAIERLTQERDAARRELAEAREEIERLRAFFRDVVIEIQPTDAATREGSIPTIGMMVTELACDFPHLAEIVRLHKKPVGRRRERKGDD